MIGDGRNPQDAESRGELRRDAAAFVSRLSSGNATSDDAEALKRWCAESPARAAAYAEVSRTWNLLETVAKEANEKDAARAAPPLLGRRAFLGGTLAASAAAASVAIVYPPLRLWPSLLEVIADARTGVGERRQIQVADGVAVNLNTRSSINFRGASAEHAHIELVAGEAVVSADSESAKPFTMAAGSGRIQGVHAEFAIRQLSDSTKFRVNCMSGHIGIEHPTATLNLTARQQVVYDDVSFGPVSSVDPMIVTAWQQGRLLFQKEKLSTVIAEVNRYRSGRIILMNSELGARVIDASFQIDRLENVIVYIAQTFAAPTRTLPGGIVLIG